MPELAECTIISEQLDFLLSNKRLVKCEILSGKYLNRELSGWNVFQAHINNTELTITQVYNMGKIIIIQFKKADLIFYGENEDENKLIEPFEDERCIYLIVTLGMCGKITNKREKNSRVMFTLFQDEKDVDSSKEEKNPLKYNPFYYTDNRNFGNLYVLPSKKDLKIHLSRVGKPIALNEKSITEQQFISNLSDQGRSYLGAVLLDQKRICCGIGNYQISEIFYRANLDPTVRCDQLTKDDMKRVYKEAVAINNESYKYGGVSIRDYVDAYGEVWEYCDKNCREFKYAIKISTIDEDPNLEFDPDSSYNAASRIGYRLNLFVLEDITPHIALTFSDFYCDGAKDKRRHVMIMEEVDMSLEKAIVSDVINLENPDHARQVIFQIILTLAAIQEFFPTFRHNDLFKRNLLVKLREKKNGTFFIYKIKDMIFKLPNLGWQLKIADFDLATIPGLINSTNLPNLRGTTDSLNPYFDIYCFIDSLFGTEKVDLWKRLNSFFMIEASLDGRPVNVNEIPDMKSGAKLVPINVLKSEFFKGLRITKDDLDHTSVFSIINVYDTNTKLLPFNTAEYVARFKKCIKPGYLPVRANIPFGSENMVELLCDSPSISMIKTMQKDVRSIVKSIIDKTDLSKAVYVNNFTVDKFTKDDVYGLTGFLLDYLISKRVVVYTDLSIIANVGIGKVLIYFSLTDTGLVLSEYNERTLYNQIFIGKSIVEQYFKTKLLIK
jgi:formamidopyrimidine-DNA glycosylase